MHMIKQSFDIINKDYNKVLDENYLEFLWDVSWIKWEEFKESKQEYKDDIHLAKEDYMKANQKYFDDNNYSVLVDDFVREGRYEREIVLCKMIKKYTYSQEFNYELKRGESKIEEL